MKRPLEIVIQVYNKKQAELTGKEAHEAEGVDCLATIDIDRIEAVRQTMKDDEDEICDKNCVILMSSGNSYVCYSHSYELMKNIINEKQ
jgi:hypothetical protein